MLQQTPLDVVLQKKVDTLKGALPGFKHRVQQVEGGVTLSSRTEDPHTKMSFWVAFRLRADWLQRFHVSMDNTQPTTQAAHDWIRYHRELALKAALNIT
jgi:hypothetical protein